MDLDLNGRHALVCGGSEGIGRAAARLRENRLRLFDEGEDGRITGSCLDGWHRVHCGAPPHE